jgi:hypothetical protein
MNTETLLFRKGKAFPFLKSRVSVFLFLEEPDDGHNRPKLVAQISK